MDRIGLRGIRAYGRHGANPGERDRAQPLDVELVFEIDLRAAQMNDDLGATVSYADVHARIVRLVGEESCMLLERLAGVLLDDLFSDARIARAELTIAKPALLDGATPSVTLVRDNPRYQPSFS